MKRQKASVSYLGSLAVMALLLIAVLATHRGMEAEARPARLARLADPVFSLQAEPQDAANSPAEVLLLVTDENANAAVVTRETLDEMKYSWQSCAADAFSAEMLENWNGIVLVCTPELSMVEAEAWVSLLDWVEAGGRLGFMTTPLTDAGFHLISRKIGITESGGDYALYTGLDFSDSILPFAQKTLFNSFVQDYTLSLHLESDCRVHITTDDESRLPLLWSRDLGKGRIAVMNNSLIYSKDSRGYSLTLLTVLEDKLVYPIINAGMVFVDDFPAPQPEGFDDRLKAQFGYDVQGFFRNHWWPDMKRLALEDGVRYTGLLIETYNDNVEGPFTPESSDQSLIRFYTSELLDAGGEIGLHGYNHQPLCLGNFEYDPLDDYEHWPSLENMKLAIEELVRYGKSFLPDALFSTYVPPSNYLSDEGWRMLTETVSDLRVISGLYLSEEGVNARVQEFCEEPDGVISVPRITAGFSISDYSSLLASQEMALHGVFSHFIHPDDVLDAERGAELGWEKMYADFSAMLRQAKEDCPPLRWCTASEGSAAIQRYDRVKIRRTAGENTLDLQLENFYDEVWLALWCDELPASAENAEIYAIADKLVWIRATGENVHLEWEAA